MNSRQLVILWAGIAGIVFMLLLPPKQMEYKHGFPGYYTDYAVLSLRSLAVILVTVGGILSFKKKKRD